MTDPRPQAVRHTGIPVPGDLPGTPPPLPAVERPDPAGVTDETTDETTDDTTA